MQTLTIPKKEYHRLVRRQEKIEKDMRLVKEILWDEMSDERIKLEVLKRWERISGDLDRGKGKTFSSPQTMRLWLHNL